MSMSAADARAQALRILPVAGDPLADIEREDDRDGWDDGEKDAVFWPIVSEAFRQGRPTGWGTPPPSAPPAGPVKLPLPKREPGKTLDHVVLASDPGMPTRTPALPPRPGISFDLKETAAFLVAAVLAAGPFMKTVQCNMCGRLVQNWNGGTCRRARRRAGAGVPDWSLNNGDYGHEPQPEPEESPNGESPGAGE